MKVVDCNGLDIYLTLHCAQLLQVVIACDANRPIPFRQATQEDQEKLPGTTHVVMIPGDLPYKGVQRLSIASECGCYEIKVYIHCPAPIQTGKHTSTPRPMAQYCCPAEPAPEP